MRNCLTAQFRESRNALIVTDECSYKRRRRLHSYCHPRQFILPFVQKPESGYCRVQGARRVSAVSSPPKERNPSELLSFSRLLPSTDLRPNSITSTPLCQRLHTARQPFRYCIATGTTRDAQTT